MEILLTLLAMLVCLLLEGFFSGSEIGVISADQMKLRHEAAKGSKGAALALKMLQKPEWLLSTTLVGTNISVVTNTTLATGLMYGLFGESGSWLAVVLVAPLIWVFGEIVPKSVFQQRADVITPRAIFALRFFSYLFFPILVVFSFLTRLLARLAGTREKNPFTLREEIVTMLDMPSQAGDIQPVEQEMIRRLFDFTETTVQQVMVPLIDVAAVERGSSVGEARAVAVERNHVLLPVYEERVDRVVGLLNTLELIGEDPDLPITHLIRPVSFVPGTKSIKNLLLDLRKSREVVAVVVDEFGGAEGIVAIEDILEEVVQDMEDEYDTEERPAPWLRKLGERDYLVSARIELDTLQEELAIVLPESRYTTLAGFLLERTHEVPSVGKVVKFEGISYTIRRATPQAIQEVGVRW